MSGSREVSVVIPTRNRWRLLSTSLKAALAQEDVDFEVIVVDDGSTDETPARLAELDTPRLRILRNESARGVAPARNLGVAEARGEWVSFLDDDDVWSPRKLRSQLDAALAQDAAFVYAAAVHFDELGTLLKVEPAPDAAGLLDGLLVHNVIPAGCSNVMARTELVRRVGGFDENLFHLADWDLWLRLAGAGTPAACSEVLVAYLKHSRNMLLVPERDVLDELQYLRAKHLAERGEVRFDAVGVSRWIAVNHMRWGRRSEAVRTYLRGAVAYRNAGNVARAISVLLGVKPREVRWTVAADDFETPDWLDRAIAEITSAEPAVHG